MLLFFFEPNNNNTICGVSATLYMVGQFTGLAYLNSKHGLHIYNFGDLTSLDGTSLGNHYSLPNEVHNLPVSGDTNNKHQGDLGNIKNQNGNTSTFSRCDNYIQNLYSLIGRGVGLHADFDHGNGSSCDQNGNSGQLYLVGVIGIANVGFAQTISVSNATRALIVSYDYSADTPTSCFIPSSSHQNSYSTAMNSTTKSINSSTKSSSFIAIGIGISCVGALILIVVTIIIWKRKYSSFKERGDIPNNLIALNTTNTKQVSLNTNLQANTFVNIPVIPLAQSNASAPPMDNKEMVNNNYKLIQSTNPVIEEVINEPPPAYSKGPTNNSEINTIVKYCGNCGAERKGIKFCEYCGHTFV